MGEWLFAQHLFAGTPNEDTYLNTLKHHAGSDANFDDGRERPRQRSTQFLDECFERYRRRRLRS